MDAYLKWAAALDSETKFFIWGGSLFLFFVYVIIDNWEVLFDDDDWHDDNQLPPDDPQPPDRMRWS